MTFETASMPRAVQLAAVWYDLDRKLASKGPRGQRVRPEPYRRITWQAHRRATVPEIRHLPDREMVS